MNTAVEILAPSHRERMNRILEGIDDACVVAKPTRANRTRLLIAWIADLASSKWRSELDQLLQQSYDTPFVLVDTKANPFKDYLTRETLIRWAANPRFYLAPDVDAVRRMIKARALGAEQRLIASATVDDGNLIVWSCEPKQYMISVEDIPALAKMSARDLEKFEVSETGSRLHWPKGDVDLDLEAVRYFADPRSRQEQDRLRRETASSYSKAIKAFRLAEGLKQSEIEGLTERQVRRIERGESMPHSSSLKKLAAAHGISVEEYLAELAKRSKGR